MRKLAVAAEREGAQAAELEEGLVKQPVAGVAAEMEEQVVVAPLVAEPATEKVQQMVVGREALAIVSLVNRMTSCHRSIRILEWGLGIK